ncbi:MAG: ATPase with chaperone, ATP-binding subunit [Patescibacteria group bacterium]|nr:ATPase with chaperone, ATP-binding subunit [Patescibacteria group bacterium]
MANGICDICKRRPSTHAAKVSRDGREMTLELCNIDYARLRQQQAMGSPFNSLFSGGMFDMLSDDFPAFSSQLGYPVPRDREATNIEEFISEHTKELLQRAAEKAVEFGRAEIDTEHLLYALADSDVVAEILRQFRVGAGDLKEYIQANAPKGDRQAPPEGTLEISVSPRVKSVLEHAFGISREMGHSYIGPEHLLIALAGEDESLAGDVLRKYGLAAESLRQKAVKVVGQGAREGRVEARTTTPQLDKYSRDLSGLAKQGKLDPVIGRAEEIAATIEILSRRTKNNPALIGEPGVGKTAIVEGLAQRILSGNVPQTLQDKRVVEVNLNAIVAGAKYRGEFEERLKAVLDEIVAHQDELVIFIDELHTIVGSGQGGGEGGLDVSNVIKPSLARGELHLIGATTLDEYQKHIEKDAALERRFQPVFVGEPTPEQTIEILRGLRDRYEAHHKVKITDEAIVAAAELSDRYIANRYLPDKAIDLIDQAASRVRIGADTFSREISGLDDQIAHQRREQEYATNHKQFDKAKYLDREISDLSTRKERLREQWRGQKGVTSQEVLAAHVAQVVSRITGIPVTELTQAEKDRLLKLEERLHERVIGQDEAISAVSDAIRASRAGLTEGHRPVATFIFLGPTGVGKTELAKTLAWIVFGDEEAVTRIDMSEYMERHTVSRLIGAPPGYVGYDEGGQLTERIRRRPYSVLLLDEIEKAHPDVHNILLQVFDDGRLTDGKGRVVDFSNTIIIATSNLGAHIIQDNLTRQKAGKQSYDQLKSQLMEELRIHFRPEFINRVDEIIVFHALTRDQIKSIAGLQLERVKRLARGQGIELMFDDSFVNHLAEAGYIPEYGARQLRRVIKSELENRLAKEILSGHITEGSTIRVTYDDHEDNVIFQPTDEPAGAPKTKNKPSAKKPAFREKLDDNDSRPAADA